MAEDYSPNWSSDEDALAEGWYIWDIFVKKMEFKDIEPGKEKPFMLLSVIVEDPQDGPPCPNTGYQFDFRIYIHKKSRGWACYFLKKFDYPQELLANDQPVLRKQNIEGLRGQVLIQVQQNQNTGYMNTDVKGFDHTGGIELVEKRAKELAKEKGEEYVPPEAQAPDERAIDVNADVAGEAPDIGSLDDLPDNSPSVEPPVRHDYQARDGDLPDNMQPGLEDLENL